METKQLNGILPNAEKEDKSNSNYELVKRKDVKNTPFQIITVEGKSFGVLGKYRITESYDTVGKVEEEVKKVTWDRIVQVVMLLTEELRNEKLIKEDKK